MKPLSGDSTDPKAVLGKADGGGHKGGPLPPGGGFIQHDTAEYGPVLDQLVQNTSDKTLNAGMLPPDSTSFQVGGLMVWAVNAKGNDEVSGAGDKAHVASIEDVQRNYEPSGDPNGKVVSYTLTISEANARNNGDQVTLSRFPGRGSSGARRACSFAPERAGRHDRRGAAERGRRIGRPVSRTRTELV